MRRKLNQLIVLFSIVIITIIISLNLVIYWLKQGPKQVDFLAPMISKYIEKMLDNHQVNFEKIVLSWDDVKNIAILDIANSKVKSSDSDDIVAVSEKIRVSLVLKWPEIFLHPVKSVEVLKPILTLKTDKLIADQKPTYQKPSHVKLQELINSWAKMDFLLINQGKIVLQTSQEEKIWHVDAALDINNLGEDVELKGGVNLNYGDDTGHILLHTMLSHKTKISSDFNLEIANIPVALLNPYGVIQEHDQSKMSLNIDSLQLKSRIDKDYNVAIESLELILNTGSKAMANALYSAKGDLLVELSLDDFAINDVHLCWPSWLIEDVRNWFVTNIYNGKISHAKGKFKFNAEDIAKGEIAAGSIQSHIDFSGVSLSYYEDLPVINEINGTAEFDHLQGIINASKGKIHQTEILNAKVVIPYDLSKQLEYVEISGKTKGPAVNLIAFIPRQIVKNAAQRNINLEKLSGSAETNVDIKIPLKANLNFNEVLFDLSSKFTQVGLDNLPDNASLAGAVLDVTFTGNKAEVKGNGKLDGNDVKIKWSACLESSCPSDTELLLSSIIHAENSGKIRVLGESPIKKGNVALDTTLTSKNDNQQIRSQLDLTNAEIRIDRIGFKKEIGEVAKAELSAAISNPKLIDIKSLNLAGKDLEIKAHGSYLRSLLIPQNLEFDHIKFLENDFHLSYQTTRKGYKIALNGDKLDMSKMDLGKLFEQNDRKQEEEELAINLVKIIGKNGIIFHKVNGQLSCDKFVCSKGKLNASIGDNFLQIALESEAEHKAKLSIISDNAGAISNGLDIYKNIRGGYVTINGDSYLVDNNHARIEGDIVIKNFDAIKTPVLAKLLTISSLPGIIKMLEGNKIAFDKLKSDFIFENGILTIKNGKVQGGQMGLTMQGKIDMRKRYIEITGTIVPDLYFLNKTIGSLPIIGSILKGGKKKEGVFAANYTIKGNVENVETFVNPVSLLTPGFIKGFFEASPK